MNSSQGTEYYLKSMNGIKAFDDGSGTVIEDDSIIVNTITCETIDTNTLNATSFNINTLTTSTIQSSTGTLTINSDLIALSNISAGSIGTTGDISGNFINCNKIDALTPSSGFNILPSQKGDIYIGNGQTGNAIFICQNKTSGFVLLGSANATTIIKRTFEL